MTVVLVPHGTPAHTTILIKPHARRRYWERTWAISGPSGRSLGTFVFARAEATALLRDFLATQHLNVLPLRRRDGVLCVPVHNGNYHIAVMNPHGHLLSHMALRMTVCRHPHADNDAPCMACDSTVIAVCRSTRHALQRV